MVIVFLALGLLRITIRQAKKLEETGKRFASLIRLNFIDYLKKIGIRVVNFFFIYIENNCFISFFLINFDDEIFFFILSQQKKKINR
jgi:hypothetical protein